MDSISPTEIKALLWAVTGLIAVLAIIFWRFVDAVIKMGKDINEIKIVITEQVVKHDNLAQSHEILREEVKELKQKVFR